MSLYEELNLFILHIARPILLLKQFLHLLLFFISRQTSSQVTLQAFEYAVNPLYKTLLTRLQAYYPAYRPLRGINLVRVGL